MCFESTVVDPHHDTHDTRHDVDMSTAAKFAFFFRCPDMDRTFSFVPNQNESLLAGCALGRPKLKAGGMVPRKDLERALSFKSLLYYWSLSLNFIIVGLLAVTIWSLLSGSSSNSHGKTSSSGRSSGTLQGPAVSGLVRHWVTSNHAADDSNSDKDRAKNGRMKDPAEEWKKVLSDALSKKMLSSKSSAHGASPSQTGSYCSQASSKCNLCAGNSSSCCQQNNRKEVFLAIMCKSAPLNSKRRQAVRVMWDETVLVDRFYAEHVLESQVYFAFIVGKVRSADAAQDKLINDGIEGEANVYGDMVVGDFLDSYTNLTTKLLYTLDWLRDNLQFRYLMMADDDTFVNVFGILQWLVVSPDTNFYAGKLEKDVLVVRDPESKWYVDRGFYGPETYPPYHQGFGYVVSCDAIERAMDYVSGIPLFGIDDTVMGMLMYVVGIQPVNMPRFFAAPYYCQMAESDHALVIGDVELSGFLQYSKDMLYIGCPVCLKKSANQAAPSKT